MERLRRLLHRFSIRKYTRHYLYRFIWFGCMSACIPVLLVGGVYYQLSMRAAVNEATQLSDSSLSLAKDRLERIFGSIELSSLQLKANPLISSTFLDGDSNEKILAHLEILKLLQVARSSNDFIDDIILYDDASEDILNNEYGFVLKKMYKLRTVLDQLMQFNQKDQCLNIRQPFMEDTLACVRFLPPSTLHKARGLLVVKVKRDLIQKYLEGPSVYSTNQSTLVLDSSNHVLVRIGRLFQDDTSVLYEDSVKSIIKSEQREGNFFMEDAAGKRFLYSYNKTEFGRTYIAKIAETDIVEHISWIRWTVALTILLFIHIGIALTIFTSLRAYGPIRKLVSLGEKLNKETFLVSRSQNDISFIQECWLYLNEQTQKINEFMKQWEPTIKESFYLRLLENGAYGKMWTNLNEHDAMIGQEPKAIVALVVKLENMYKEKRFQRDDGPILSFIVKNVIDEIMKKLGTIEGEVVIDHSGRGTAIVAFADDIDEHEMKIRLSRFASELVQSFEGYLKWNVCIGVGSIYRRLEDVAISYKEALEALQYRLYKEQSQIIFIDDLDTHKKQPSFFYPFYIEESLIENLEKRHWKEAEHSLKEYIAVVRSSESPLIVSQCYVMLVGSITKSLIRKGYTQIFADNPVYSLQERTTPSEVYDWFVQYVFPYYEKVMEVSDHTNMLVVKVCQYINERIHEDISLVYCAELVGISPSQLSKLFKKETGMHFLDYVLERKLKAAQYLLTNTKLTVHEIAERIGYSERSLIRIFQKYLHVTPSQFRTMHL